MAGTLGSARNCALKPITSGACNGRLRNLSSSAGATAGSRRKAQFTSTDTLASLPANYSFIAADAGIHTFNVVLKTARCVCFHCGRLKKQMDEHKMQVAARITKRGKRLAPGMTIAIEPMVNVGTAKTRTLGDKWTVVTADGKRSAHFEHTVAVTDKGPRVLTGALIR